VLLEVLTVTACGGPSPSGPKSLFTITSMRSASGQAEVLLAPGGRPKGLVLFEHGFGQTERVLLRTPGFYPLRDALLRDGYAIASSYSHGDNMGTPVSVHDQVVLAADAEQKLADLPDTAPVDVVGFSMGGLDTLMVASRHAIRGLDAVVVLSGMCDQLSFLEHPTLGPAIRRAYGDRTGASLLAALDQGDPARQDPRTFAGYRYWFWQSRSDTTVPYSQAAGMVALLQGAGASVQLSLLSGNHGDLALLAPDRIVGFFDQAP